MSSMRNAVQRRNHKERAQPLQREKWGVLEKHKDYSLRAKDYNEKKKRLKILRQKAAARNPDEFHFGMMNSKTHNGGQKLADRGNKALSQDAVKLLKTQDAGYLRTVVQKTKRAREKLEQEFFLGEDAGVKVLKGGPDTDDAEHIIFVQSREEQIKFSSGHSMEIAKGYSERRLASHQLPTGGSLASEEEGEDDDRTALQIADHLNPNRAAESKQPRLQADRALRKQHKRERETRNSKLEALRVREKDLVAAEQELGLQRAKMSNSIGGVNNAGVKWKVRERKK